MDLIKSKKGFRLLFILIISCFSTGILSAQDIVVTTKQDTLYGKVKLYADTGVALFSGAKDSIYIEAFEIEKIELKGNQTILYDNYSFGFLDNYYKTSNLSGDSLYMLGVADAFKYYKGYKLGSSINFIAGMLIYPAIPVVLGTSLTKPNYSNLNIPKEKENLPSQYYRGYSDQAYKIKKRKMISNSALGIGTSLVASLTISAIIFKTILH